MSEKKEIEVQWVVKNADFLWKEKVSIMSPTFDGDENSDKFKWRLIITRTVEPETNGETITVCEKATDEIYMSLYVRSLYSLIIRNIRVSDTILKVTFSLIHPIGGEILSQSKIQFDVCSKNLFGFEKFISMKKLKKFCLDEFTIQCKFQKLSQDFKSYAHFFNQNTCSDMKLMVKGAPEVEVFPAHKLVLALGSRYFQKIFSQNESISFSGIVDTRSEVFIEILKYMYTGEVVYAEELVYELFEAALTYSVRGLRGTCQKFLVQNLKVGNVIRTLLSCRKKRIFFYTVDYLKELIPKCMSLIDKHLDEVMRLDLCKELLEKGPEILTEVVVYLSTSNFIARACVKEERSASSQSFKKIFEGFAKSSDFSDTLIQVNDLKYPAHKLILAARSPVFRRIFSQNMKETISGVVTIENIRPQVFEELLRFMYTNEIEGEDELIPEILIASDQYEMNDLKLICEEFLEEKLTGENVIITLIFAADHNAERLKKKCLEFITRADSPFWSNSSDHFKIPKTILIRNLVKSHPYLLYDMLKEIHQNRFS